MRHLIMTVLLAAFTMTAIGADAEMPIIAYMGVPNDQTSHQHFKDFSDCGFNVSLYGYASLRQLI